MSQGTTEGSTEYFSDIILGAKYTDTLPGTIGQTGVSGVATELSFNIDGTSQACIDFMDGGLLKKVWISTDRLQLG